MHWVSEVARNVRDALTDLPREYQKRLVLVFEEISKNPYSGDVRKIKGEYNVWRRRVGPYRIFYELFLKERKILIFKLERRTTTMYR